MTTRRQFAQVATLAFAGAATLSWARESGAMALLQSPLNTDFPPPSPEVHLLNRISFGITPEELTRIQTIGIDAYIEEQLHPEQIDDSAVDNFIATAFPSVGMPLDELAALSPADQSKAAAELRLATVYRAIFSRRQLFEMLVDFWSNHFNIYQLDGPVLFLKTVDDREVIRAHALGYFPDMLNASARSPAMLYYLDNFNNTRFGPNENYARELMELHTLGVDGGYTEQDVLEVARCFTGWTINPNPAEAGFIFVPQLHDNGEKQVLGATIPAGQGIADGEQVLAILAVEPATARFIASKLCRRLVSDDPPASLIDSVALSYQQTGGDIRAMLRTLLWSPEFAAATDSKFKRPLEFIVSTVRAIDAELQEAAGLLMLAGLERLGQQPFDWPAPNGYPDIMGYWAGTNGLLNRWNINLALGEGRLPGISLDWNQLLGDSVTTSAQLVDQLADRLLHRPLSSADRTTLISYVNDNGKFNAPLPVATLVQKAPGLLALLLGSYYFQMR